MLKEQNAQRHTQMEEELAHLCYRRLLLTRELEAIDKNVLGLEGAIRENEQTLRDLKTEESIQSAKAEAEAKEDGG